MADETKSNLTTVIEQINKNEILLPDFQRNFVWKDEEQQKKLVASVLCKMPIGSILLLQANPNEYAAKVIGCAKKKVDTGSLNNDVYFLLDGQQRITVLANVFSNVIHENCPKVSELISISLKKRFFLTIPDWKPYLEDDWFGVSKLQFPFERNDIPTYLTAQIYKYIHIENFTANDDEPFNPAKGISTDLDDFCLAKKSGPLIPLFFMCPFGTKATAIKTRFSTIVNRIADKIKESIINHYELLDKKADKCRFLSDFFDGENIDILDDSKIKNALEERKDCWGDGLKSYLNSCIDDISMGQIKVSASQRARAIDIYENLNRGGVCLNTFDLIMARVAKVSSENFYTRVKEAMESEKKYPVDVLPDKIKIIISNKISQHKYNATMAMKCLNLSKGEINSKYIDIFLDALTIYSNVQDLNPDKIKLDHIKKNTILSLLPEQINDNCEKVIIALDRAMFFLQTRCGIRSIKEVNYALMLLVITVVFLKEKNFYEKKIHDLLEAWYWSVLFSGEYDKDQNSRAIDNLKNILSTIKTKDITWLNTIKISVFNFPNFSDKKLLLMQKVQDGRRPKKNIGNFICQYMLAKVYPDMFDNDKNISVFCADSENLQIHHIIPLATMKKIGESSKKLRDNPDHICNSPINLVYITDEANKAISAQSLDYYASRLLDGAKSALHISVYSNKSDVENTEKIKGILSNRFDALKGEVENRIKDCLLAWQ